MMIRHILKDGTILQDITDHVVRVEDAEAVYTLMDKMNEQGGNDDRKTGHQ